MDDNSAEQNSDTNSVSFSPPTNCDLYSSLATMWSGAIGAQHSLLASYITAHSFLIAALVLLFISIGPKNSPVVVIGVLLVSAVGMILSLQMALAWGRFIARVSLFEWHLQRLEGQFNPNLSTVFIDWAKIRDNPKNDLIDPTDNNNRFYANWSVKHHKKWWATRAKMIPVLVGLVYFLFFSVSAVKTSSIFFNCNGAITSTSGVVKKANKIPKAESSSKETSNSLSKEKTKTK